MFTGIVTDVGRITAIEERGDTRLTVQTTYDLRDLQIGASVAVNGVCLTVVAKQDQEMAFDMSGETAGLTNLGHLQPGTRVNLERALKVGDELGGHIVSGHVDGVGRITAVTPEGGSHRVSIAAPAALGRYIAPKGSITLDGISLTVNEVADDADSTVFGVNIIPHTWGATNLSEAGEGTHVNLEIDVLARYVARLAEAG